MVDFSEAEIHAIERLFPGESSNSIYEWEINITINNLFTFD